MPWLYQPGTAIRIDSDIFGYAPSARRAYGGKSTERAVIDYVLDSSAKEMTLEIFDAQQKPVRRFSSADRPPQRAPGAIADRWIPKPEVLATTSGMHRFVWDLTWGVSEEPMSDEGGGSRPPNPPRRFPENIRCASLSTGKPKHNRCRLSWIRARPRLQKFWRSNSNSRGASMVKRWSGSRH